ncbi:MAG: S-layer homology domain-containing protein [Clostridia bacterium]|nr:S-layer homology domain-containing protein [Clostridia bacterium]
MKKVVLIICILTVALSMHVYYSSVRASGELNDDNNETTNITPISYQVANSSFEVKRNVDFPDLVKMVYNPQTRKEEEVAHEDRREILIAARIGFIEGYEDGSFRPDNPITRAEFIKMLMGLATNRTFNFETIPSSYHNWAGKFVTLAEMQGVIEKGKYTEKDLEQPITRIEVICMLAKVQIKMKGIPQSQLGHLIYTDIDGLTKEEKGLLLHAASYDLLEGMKDGTMKEIEPNKNITRAETARALVRIY